MAKVVLTALVSGLALGVVARAWMRWISTDPEFTWSGTIYIIIAFMILMTNQSVVQLLRQRFKTKRSVQFVRIGGVIFSQPIFIAAGAVMFPAVVLASVGIWNTTLGKRSRGVLVLSSLIIPIKVSIDIISDFGWTFATLGRILLFASIYILVIIALRPTATPYRDENSEAITMSKGKEIFLLVAVISIGVLLFLSTVGIMKS